MKGKRVNVGGLARLTLHVSSGAPPPTRPREGLFKEQPPSLPQREMRGARSGAGHLQRPPRKAHTSSSRVHAASEPLIFIVFNFFILIFLHKHKLDMFLLPLTHTWWSCRLWEFLRFLSVHFQICEELFCKGIRI